MARFFPDASRVTEARNHLAEGRYCDVDRFMHAGELARPQTDELPHVLEEFRLLAVELGLSDEDDGFIVLVPVCVNGSKLTTPILVDLQRRELLFTSHPTFGAGAIPAAVLEENADLASAVRERLLGVLATWHNHVLLETDNGLAPA